ncbi:putative DNA primase/helicase [Methylobacterium sp. 275MFSha3.1]|uniref:phage/plasmid primase, P4 family n=1 Tax=Methylobacterium sp. 275MFSha3.1 TaxID=1502746 RepID=UPI0008A7B9C0|nr:phage/plasmid primase, P4 family [Methylobacterium sp. 275MFSha3.1]SEI15018.1 putative DNA primase/helicase [Methylobacterium sp. 275MFSha3.1]
MAAGAEDIHRLFEFEQRNRSREKPKSNGDLLTEDWAARTFAERRVGHLLFCHDTGKWHTWTGAAWRPNRCGLAFQWARELAREMCENEEPKTRFIASKTAFAAGVERFSRSDPVFAVTIEGWDADPWLLGTPGGTVDLRTGKLREADRADRITKLTAVAPGEKPDCPTWLKFLDDVTQGDAGYIRFLQQWAGYCLTGDTSEQALCFAYGGGGNGKGVLIHVLAGILADYAVNAAMETFTAAKHDRHPTEIAALRGARLVTASETEQGRQWAEARIKQLTGGDTMRARYMRQDEFEFTPVLKLLIIGNNKPGLSSVDDAARRRFNLLPFLFKPAVPDPQLEEKLRKEWPEILRWMIEGCLDWQAHRLVRPEVVKDATDEYFATQDTFGQWLEARCIVQHGNNYRKATTQELFASWSEYARGNNEPPGTQTSFGDRLDKLGFKKNKNVPTGMNTRARGYEGIEVRPLPTMGAEA